MKMTVPIAAAAAALLGCVASPAFGAGERASLSMPFKATTPATQTGLTLDLRYFNPNDPAAKPPTIQKLALHLPDGTRLDPAAVPVCGASDLEIRLRGRDACPPESLVGTGKLDVYLGAPGDPQTTDLALFNGPGQILEVLLFEGTNVTAAVEHLLIRGTTISASPAQVPPIGPPELRVAASRIAWEIPANGRYLITPPTCPPERLWRTTGNFAFGDGGSTTVASTQSCEGAVRERRAGRGLRVAVRPRRLTRGRPTRLRVRVYANDRACIRGATVRVGRKSARTNARGRATLVVRVRTRRPSLRVHTRRCGSTRVKLRTRRGSRPR
jgi:hypothetical protein